MRFEVASLLLAAASAASAQSVVGKPYGFASGVTGGADAKAAAPSSVEQLTQWLSDDEARTILIDKEFDFTGETTSGPGCDRKVCSSAEGGQLYLGELSCGGSDVNPVSSITYDKAGPSALRVGSNKSIISSNGKGVLKGKGLELAAGASNVIIQGIEFTNINPGIVWGGDALGFKGGNDGVWVDHCKFSLVGRMFIVSHYKGSRITISNNEFDGVTTTSASCNNDHYWTMMFIADGDKITLDKNYFHDVSGRAPKLGQDGVSSTVQASNNLFSNMEGHAFDAYNGVSAIIEGNAFESVKTPITEKGASIRTVFDSPNEKANAACQSVIGRACAVNSLTQSGDWPEMADTSGLTAWASNKKYIVDVIPAAEVSAHVKANAGPANLGAAPAPEKTVESPVEEEPTVKETAVAETAVAEEPAQETPVAETPAPAETSVVEKPATETPVAEKPAENKPVVQEPTAEEPAEEESCDAEPIEDDDDDEESCDAEPVEDDVEDCDEEPDVEKAAEKTSTGGDVPQWERCGGIGYTGSTKCVSGTSCVVQNDYYSQCLSSSARRAKRALRVVN